MMRLCERRIGRFCCVLAVPFLLLSLPSTSAGRDTAVPDPSVMLALVPGASEASPPPCIKLGTRIIYFGMTASIPGEYKKLVQDDNGRWIDPKTNKRYDEEDIAGAAASAFKVLYVGHVDRLVVQVSTKLYTLDTSTKKCLFAVGGGIVSTSGCAADYWIHPDALKELREVDREGVRILRMPYQLGQKHYRAIRVQTEDMAGYHARMYDLETGMLIFHASRSQGPDIVTPPVGGGGRPGVGAGSTQVVVGWIVEIKDLDVPWKDEPMPEWASEFTRLEYRGTQQTTVAAAGTRLDRALSMTVTPKARGAQWLRFSNGITIETLQGLPPEHHVLEDACGVGTVGGAWIAPSALASLRRGQTLETNDIVKTRVEVSEAGDSSVTISEIGPLHRIDYGYDRGNGVLSAMNTSQQMGLGNITHRVRLTDMK